MENSISLSGLLRLPYELRQIVYRFVLVQDPLKPVYAFRLRSWYRTSSRLSLDEEQKIAALLQVSKLTRDEGYEVFLRENIFSIDCDDTPYGERCFARWLVMLGPYARHVRRLMLCFYIPERLVFESCFPGSASTGTSWRSPYFLKVVSRCGKQAKMAIDECPGPRLHFRIQPGGKTVTASRTLEITNEDELETEVSLFLTSLNPEKRYDVDVDVTTALEIFCRHAKPFDNDRTVFMELWKKRLWEVATGAVKEEDDFFLF